MSSWCTTGLPSRALDVTSHAIVARLECHSAVSYSLATHGSWVIANDAGRLRVWDLSETHPLDSLTGQVAVRAIIEGVDDHGTLVGEGSSLIAVDEHGTARHLASTPDQVVGLAVTRAPDREVLAAAMWKGRLGAWSLTPDGRAGKLGTGRAPDRDERFSAVAVRRTGNDVEIVTAGRNRPGQLRTWGVAPVIESHAAQEISDTFVDAMALMEVEGQLLVAAAVEAGIELWDADGTKLLERHGFGSSWPSAVALGRLSPGVVVAGARAPHAGDLSEIMVWTADGEPLAVLDSGGLEVERLALGVLGGRDVVAASQETRVRVWALSGRALADIDLDASVHALMLRSSDVQVGTSKGHVSIELHTTRLHAIALD